LLRSPTVFEDVIKMICTTNCTWALTTVIVRNLVEVFGVRFDDSVRAFPTPEAIARSNESILRGTIKAGYRAPYLLEFARAAASGRINPESWRTSQGEADDLYRQILTVKGVGPYAAQNLMKLLGRYDYLALDSWVREKYAELHHRGRRVKDSAIERYYASFGQWRGLFFWLEMTRHWHDGKFPP
jgi:3-methyladenine DNA glycosylase/8-oxoguanine DNA glycosylase